MLPTKDFSGKWSITPEIEGDLIIENKERLDFTPKNPLLPNQTYTIQIEEIESASGDTICNLPILTIGRKPSPHLSKSWVFPLVKSIENLENATIIVNLSHPIPLAEVKSNTTILLNGKIRGANNLSIEGNNVSIDINADSLLDQTLEVSVEPLAYSDTISSGEIFWKGELGNWKKFTCMVPMSKKMLQGLPLI